MSNWMRGSYGEGRVFHWYQLTQRSSRVGENLAGWRVWLRCSRFYDLAPRRSFPPCFSSVRFRVVLIHHRDTKLTWLHCG